MFIDYAMTIIQTTIKASISPIELLFPCNFNVEKLALFNLTFVSAYMQTYCRDVFPCN